MNRPGRVRRRRGAIILAVLALVLLAIAAATLKQWRASRIAAASGLEVSRQGGPMTFSGLGKLSPDFDVTTGGVAQITPASGGLLSVTPAGRGYLYAVKGEPITSFALDDDDNPLTIAGNFLGRLTENRETVHAVPMPTDGNRLARSVHKGAVYLYGNYGADWRVYRFWEIGRFEVLLKSEQPIVGVTDSGSAFYVATARAIFRMGGNGVRAVFIAPADPGWGPITSIAVTLDGQLLFATAHQVWAVARSGAAGTLINDAGDQIRRRGDRFYVLDRQRQLLFSFAKRKDTTR